MGRFIILSGPSCIGKGPLHAAFRKFHPELADKLTKLVLYNSRAPRPAEIDGKDYHFRRREEIESFRNKDNFIVLDVRGDLQAADLNDADEVLRSGDLFYEGNPFVARKLQTAFASKVSVLSIYLAPLSRGDFASPRARETCPAGLRDRRHAAEARAGRNGERDSVACRPENIERRAGSAYTELKEACHFDHVLPNHDGEDSENWDAFTIPSATPANTPRVCRAGFRQSPRLR